MNRNKTVGEALREGKVRLKSAGKENYAFEAEILLEKAAGHSRTALFLRREEWLSAECVNTYEEMLARRESGRPLQYILGEWEFMGLPFFVGEGVLIPRGDTEVLVETILEKQKEEAETNPLQTVLDIGTGSGCISVSLGKYGDFREILAVDISPKALEYARKNAARNGVAVEFWESDLFAAFSQSRRGKLDAIVSNPPYIPQGEIAGLMEEVREFEPHNALDGGKDGLDFYRRIVKESQAWLRDGGWLFFEIGYHQGAALLALLQENGFVKTQIRQDLTGLDRVAFGQKPYGR